MNLFDPTTFSVQHKTSVLASLVAAVALLACFTFLGRQDRKVMDEANKDLVGAIRMIKLAPAEGDFEIHYPAIVAQGDVVVSRINGASKVTLPLMPVDRCTLVVGKARTLAFDRAHVQAGNYTSQVGLGTADGRAIAMACGGSDTEMVQVSLTPKS